MNYIVAGVFTLAVFITSQTAHGQIFGNKEDKEQKDKKEKKDKNDRRKFYQSSNGLLLGYERGRNDFFHLGYEYNWKKIRFKRPVIRAVDGFAEYNFWENVIGMKAAYWQRHGRMKLTYGGHVGYFSDFKESSLSVGPSVGFRILGFHGQAGYNIMLSQNEIRANRLYLSLNYFIPYHSKISTRKGGKEKNILKW